MGETEDNLQVASNERTVLHVCDTLCGAYTLAEYAELTGGHEIAAAATDSESVIIIDGELQPSLTGLDSLYDDDGSREPRGTFGVRGRLLYQDPRDSIGVFRPAVNVWVKVMDFDTDPWICGSDDYIASGITDWNGSFEITAISNEDCIGSADPYVQFVTANSEFSVQFPFAGTYWEFRSSKTFLDIQNGTIVDFGTDCIAKTRPFAGAMWCHQFMNLAWNVTASTGLWPGLIRGFWPWSDTYEYETRIYIGGSDADAIDIVAHEYGHALLHKAYGYQIETCDYGDGHYIDVAYCEELGWSEGWASFVSLVTDPDGKFNWEGWATAPSFELEYLVNSWLDPGPACEGRVAAALLDLWDANDETLDLNSDYPVTFEQIWADCLHGGEHGRFVEFWDALKADYITKPQAYRGVKSLQQDSIYFAGVMRGDCNVDDAIDIDDEVYLVNYVFGGGSPPMLYFAIGDVNCAGDPPIDIDDIVYMINFLFGSGPAPCDFE